MSRPLVPFFFVGTFALLSACSGTKSAQQTMAEDRAYMYKEAYSAYIAAENKYLNLLFNIERMPEEEELWIMKRDQMRELEQLRDIVQGLFVGNRLHPGTPPWFFFEMHID